MKVILPIDGDNIESPINNSFGRCKQFIFVETTTNEFSIIENLQNAQAAQGAGIQSAQAVIKSGVDAVISLHLGPKAYRVLFESGIKIYYGVKSTIKENIKKLVNGELEEMHDANVESHWV